MKSFKLQDLLSLGQVVLFKSGMSFRFGSAVCIPVDPCYGGEPVNIPLVIDTSESLQVDLQHPNESWMCIENTPEDFHLLNKQKVDLLVRAISKNLSYVYSGIALAIKEGVIEKVHKGLINRVIPFGFAISQEKDDSGIEVHIERYAYLVPIYGLPEVPLSVCLIEKRNIHKEGFNWYVYPQMFSMGCLPNVSFCDITEVAHYYQDRFITNTSMEVNTCNGMRELTQEEILFVSINFFR